MRSIEVIWFRTEQNLLAQFDRETLDKASQPVYEIYLGSGSEQNLKLAVGIVINGTGISAYLILERYAPQETMTWYL